MYCFGGTSVAAEIRVVVGCTDRKSLPVTDHLRLGNVASTTDRIKVWQERIENAPCRSAAGSLYAGEAWSVARSLPTATLKGEAISRWIVSAGYGLIQYSDPISPYSAAFAPGGPDSVAVRGESHAAGQWWDELSKWRPPGIFGPRSLRDLALEDPEAPIVVAVSATYLKAIWNDLTNAAEVSEQVVVLGRSAPPGVTLVPCDARIQSTVGGARTSMNNRALRLLLEQADRHEFRPDAMASHFEALLADGAIKTYEREAQTDDQVRRFIRAERNKHAGLARTPALRMLRDRGFACKQERFRELWEQIVEEY